jgi:hypothetical protein
MPQVFPKNQHGRVSTRPCIILPFILCYPWLCLFVFVRLFGAPRGGRAWAV